MDLSFFFSMVSIILPHSCCSQRTTRALSEELKDIISVHVRCNLPHFSDTLCGMDFRSLGVDIFSFISLSIAFFFFYKKSFPPRFDPETSYQPYSHLNGIKIDTFCLCSLYPWIRFPSRPGLPPASPQLRPRPRHQFRRECIPRILVQGQAPGIDRRDTSGELQPLRGESLFKCGNPNPYNLFLYIYLVTYRFPIV